jgi:hypothetical protein
MTLLTSKVLGLTGDRSVGVRRAEDIDAGEKSGDLDGSLEEVVVDERLEVLKLWLWLLSKLRLRLRLSGLWLEAAGGVGILGFGCCWTGE